jgi:hypothetical protein
MVCLTEISLDGVAATVGRAPAMLTDIGNWQKKPLPY